MTLAHQQVALHARRGSAGWRGSPCRGRAGSAACRPAAGGRACCGIVEVAGEQRAVIRLGAGAVDDDVLAPAVEDVAVRVGEAVGDVDLELLRARLVAEDAARWRSAAAGRRASRPGCGGTSLPGSRAPRPGRARSCWRCGACRPSRGRRARGSRTSALPSPLVSLRNIRSGAWATQDAAVAELEAGRAVQAVGEDGHLVGLAVAVGVFEDQDLVVHLLLGLPVRIARPDGHPQPALGVERHLHRLGQLGNSFSEANRLTFIPLATVIFVMASSPLEEEVRAVRAGAGLVGLDRDERRRVAVVDLEVAPLGDGPDPLVAVGGHHVEHFHLALHDLAVGLPADELEVGPAAVDRVAVDRAVAVEPVEVLVEHRLAELLQRLRVAVRRGRIAEQGLVDDLGERLVAVLGQVDAVDRQRLARPCAYGRLASAGTGRRTARCSPWPPRPWPSCRARAACCCALPSGRLRSCRSSWAMGEKRTSRGALLPLYFWASVFLMKSSRSSLNLARPACPANDSL